MNKQYTKEAYEALVPKIIEHMNRTGEWGQFFPEFFAPNPYEESYSGFHFPRSQLNPLLDRPFEVQAGDIDFANKIEGPLPNSYYIKRIQENFRWMPFNGTLRQIKCAHCTIPTHTNWPENLDTRIICEECYLKFIK